jgi:hypothetical protein
VILGGGYIGLEFGQMFRRFGSEVTIIEGAPRLMTMEDEDVADEVAAILRDDGITVLTLDERRPAWSGPTAAACGWPFAPRTASGGSRARTCCRPSAASRTRRR